jgi:hypothetical protein
MALFLKDLLPNIINPEKNWKTDLLFRWQEIIGPLHTKVRIEKIQSDILFLGVFHSCWMQELYLLSPLLIKTINEKLDQPHIKQIRFKQISLKKDKTQKKARKYVEKKEVALSQEDERSLAAITDPALRDALRAFRIRCYQE